MKIGLLTTKNLSNFRINTLMPILNDSTFSIKLVLIDDKPKKTLKQKLIKNIKRGRGGYIFVMAFESFLKRKDNYISTKNFCKKNKISIHTTKNIYSKKTIDIIKEYHLDILLLIGGYGIIKQPLLNLTSFGILSYHHGNMRKYRGMPPGLWEIYYGENQMGITVQILASGLDRGIPIEEKTIKIDKYDTVKKLQNRATHESIDMMYKALKKLSIKNFTPIKIQNYGKVYTLPNLKQWVILNMRILWRWLK